MAASAPSHYRMLTISREMSSSTFLDEDGRPSFNILQNYGSAQAPVLYFVFDVMILRGRSVMRETLKARREILERNVLPKLAELATRFIPSVVPRMKMISLAAAAFTNLATVSRAAPSRCAARAASAWTGEGLALSVE
jgi:ATP dependent DNA ligase domain